MRRMAEVRYAGQGHELSVVIPDGTLSTESLDAIERDHATVYAGHYGYAEPAGTPLEATNWKLELACVAPAMTLGATRGHDGGEPRKGSRPVYFPELGGFVDCPVYDRYRLVSGAVVLGPAVIEERETTIVLLPSDRASVDQHDNLVVDLGSPED